MIVEAIDKRTKRIVKIKEALPGQRCTCIHCGAEMHPVLEVKTPFFRCVVGEKHTHYLCEQLEKTNRAYDPQLTDVVQLFANLFKAVRGKDVPPEDPEEDKNPEAFGPENGDRLDDDPEKGTEVDVGDGDTAGETEADEEDKEDKEDEKNEPSEPLVLPCKTLSQLWKAGIQKFGPSERVGAGLRSDIFLWYKDFDRFFARRESLGERVIAVKPYKCLSRENAIVFGSYSKARGSEEWRVKYFVLTFQERKEYNRACKKLFDRNTENVGSSETVPKYKMVLVAGDWTELDEEKSAVYVKSGKNNYGVQSSPLYSKNQIYPIPQYKIKG